jgi:hypothetical protein
MQREESLDRERSPADRRNKSQPEEMTSQTDRWTEAWDR